MFERELNQRRERARKDPPPPETLEDGKAEFRFTMTAIDTRDGACAHDMTLQLDAPLVEMASVKIAEYSRDELQGVGFCHELRDRHEAHDIQVGEKGQDGASITLGERSQHDAVAAKDRKVLAEAVRVHVCPARGGLADSRVLATRSITRKRVKCSHARSRRTEHARVGGGAVGARASWSILGADS